MNPPRIDEEPLINIKFYQTFLINNHIFVKLVKLFPNIIENFNFDITQHT